MKTIFQIKYTARKQVINKKNKFGTILHNFTLLYLVYFCDLDHYSGYPIYVILAKLVLNYLITCRRLSSKKNMKR